MITIASCFSRLFVRLLLQNKLHTHGRLITLIFTAGFSLSSVAQLDVNSLNSGAINEQDVVDELLGVGASVAVSNILITGDTRCIGTFTGGNGLGSGALGFDAGAILSSGQAIDAAGPNQSDETTSEFSQPGDPFLDTFNLGENTFDACVIEFDFECPTGTDSVSVDYVMGSEEYNEFVGPFGGNDVFAFALNGTNISTIPTSGGLPVAIANLNCENPYNPLAPVSPNSPFCDFFINNDLQDGGGSINIEADGLTTVLTAQGNIVSGVNHMKFAVADVLDEAFDTWVFLKRGSFQCVGVQPPSTPPVALDDDYVTTQGAVLSVSPADGVLANDTDADGDQFQVDSFDSVSQFGGAVTVNPNGEFTYTSATGFAGHDTFSYTIVDEQGETDSATVTIRVDATNNRSISVNLLNASMENELLSGEFTIQNHSGPYDVQIDDLEILMEYRYRGQGWTFADVQKETCTFTLTPLFLIAPDQQQQLTFSGCEVNTDLPNGAKIRVTSRVRIFGRINGAHSDGWFWSRR